MNRILLIIILLGAFFFDSNAQVLKTPSEGKSLVYFTRPSSAAMLIGFKIYDNEIYVDKLKHSNYIAYECNAGKHVFVAKSENTNFLEAELEEGKVYIVELQVQMGLATARLKFVPLDPADKKFEKKKKKTLKFLAKENKGKDLSEDSEGIDPDMEPSKVMKKFLENKEKGKKITQLTADMFIEE